MIQRLKRSGSDSGATLLIVLVIITTVALVGGATLSYSSTSVMSTVALRDETGASYNADGAGQYAVNALRSGLGQAPGAAFTNVAGTSCFGADSTHTSLDLANFYPATTGQAGNSRSSASVVCTPEAGTGAQGSPVLITATNRPGQAIYTHGALDFGDSAAETDYVRGGISAGGNLSVKGNVAVTGAGSTLTTSGSCPQASAVNIPCTHPATGADPPNMTVPAKPAAAVAPTCPTNKNGPEVFTPGTYNSVPESYLGVNCSKGPGWLYFTPGLYYFDNIGSWTIGGTTVVGGTLDLGGDGTGSGGTTTSPSSTMPAPSVPGACVNPIKTQNAVGVKLVFSGSSGVVFNGSDSEFCASFATLSVPTVFYGTPSATGTVISTKSGSKPDFFFEGFVYAPQSAINLTVNNSSQPFMNFGVVANTLHLGANPSTTCATCPFINLPDNSPGFGTDSTVLDLAIYICPGVNTGDCKNSPSKTLQLTARVQAYDPGGDATKRQMKILSWSQLR
jgi:hypothetical protein